MASLEAASTRQRRHLNTPSPSSRSKKSNPIPEMHHRHYRPINRRINWKQQDKGEKGKHRSVPVLGSQGKKKDKEPFLEEMATEKRWCGKGRWEWSVGGSNPNSATAREQHVFMAKKV
ncbi:unnamed protein product [Miscanthus lutarioriparius]|uniref:Uncharacterized protein n=1 Tax=Miscanthus lutarioriparius TaxID=422564 RepID=A0A811MMA2_9POAL|nr:unnamed protein product [Miscanthus lutarioriparius]